MKRLQTLSTKRLTLEPVTAAHAAEAWTGVNDDRMWTYFPELRPRSLEHLHTIYERRERGSPDSLSTWLNYICRERASGAIAGEAQATILKDEGVAYVAYAIFSAFQRKGYAREAVSTLIEHVRSQYGIDRFRAEMDTRNEPSYRLAESLGFKRIETHKGIIHGTIVADEYLYELRFA
jgi:[ribosomal protein S5]-alanine N-acetyltransferase